MAGKTPGQTATSTGAEPPFSIGGKTVGASTSGGRDFTKENRPSAGAESGANSFNDNNSGGRDFTKENRPQTDAKKEVEPNQQEIPAGGPILKADPQPVSKKVSGTAPGPQEPKPFKSLK
jgi:hypothetical protein